LFFLIEDGFAEENADV
jgi:hypothetical protein